MRIREGLEILNKNFFTVVLWSKYADRSGKRKTKKDKNDKKRSFIIIMTPKESKRGGVKSGGGYHAMLDLWSSSN